MGLDNFEWWDDRWGEWYPRQAIATLSRAKEHHLEVERERDTAWRLEFAETFMMWSDDGYRPHWVNVYFRPSLGFDILQVSVFGGKHCVCGCPGPSKGSKNTWRYCRIEGNHHNKSAGIDRRCKCFKSKCPRYTIECSVCGGYGTANFGGICRFCRRYIASKEREFREERCQEKRESQQREWYRKGWQTMRQVRSLLKNPERLQSAAEEFARAKTSRTS